MGEYGGSGLSVGTRVVSDLVVLILSVKVRYSDLQFSAVAYSVSPIMAVLP
jgi:hypothetical protein